MILGVLVGTIAVATPASVPVATPDTVVTGPVARRLVCRAEFGTASLVQRVRVCHTAADWRVLDARRRERRRHGLQP